MRKTALSSIPHSVPSAKVSGGIDNDHPRSRHLVLSAWTPADPLLDVVHLVLLASTSAQVALRLVLAITSSHAVVSATLVFDDLQAT